MNKFLFLLLMPVLFISCSSDELTEENKEVSNPYVPIELSRGEEEVANAEFLFGWKLLQKVSEANRGENVCISPLSASIDLTMLLNGADGETLEEIINVLGLEGKSVQEINENSKFLTTKLIECDKGCNLQFANSIWFTEYFPVKASYKNVLLEYFNASALNTTRANFSKDVNSWCYKNTNGQITELFKDEEQLDCALLNALYFMNVWNEGVKFKLIGEEEFTNFNGDKVKTSYMAVNSHRSRYAESDICRTARITFGNGAYYMSVTLPNEGVSLEECMEEFTNVDKFLGREVVYVDITMPKFEIYNKLKLDNALYALGIHKAFNPIDSEFPYITDGKIAVGDVKQVCRIKVDEEGAEAAAVTEVGIWTSSPNYRKVEPLVLNKPFIFSIGEYSTNTILFLGTVEKF